MKLVYSALVIAGTITVTAFSAHAQEIATQRDIGPAIIKCWQPPPESDGLTATVRFSFRRSGELMGPPRITFARLGDNDRRGRAFLRSVADAFVQCTPLRFSAAFAAAVPGRIFTMRFIPQARRA